MYASVHVVTRTAWRKRKKRSRYLPVSAHLIFSLLHLVFLLIYLSEICSLGPSHNPQTFCFALQSRTSENIFRGTIIRPFGWIIIIYMTGIWLRRWSGLGKDISCLINFALFPYDCGHCSILLARGNYLEVNIESCLRAERRSAWRSSGNDSAKARPSLSLSLSAVSDLVYPPVWSVVLILCCQTPC